MAVAHDKLDHFVYAAAIFALVHPVSPAWALFLSLTVPAAKEYIWDRRMGRGHFDIDDLATSWAGAGVAAIWLVFVVPYLKTGLS